MVLPQKPGGIRPPWRDELDLNIDQSSIYEFTLATIDRNSAGQPIPRARICSCRGFFPELDIHPNGRKDFEEQEDGDNPPVYESDLLSFSTDIRMEKLAQIETSGHSVEALFWLKDMMTQWRVQGLAYAIGDPVGEENEKEKSARDIIGPQLRVKPDIEDLDLLNKWTWDRAVTKYFAKHSPLMRGSFIRPHPGLPRSDSPSDKFVEKGHRITDLHDVGARSNFRVVLIIPEEVERLDISDYDNFRRIRWNLVKSVDEDGQPQNHWEETELNP
ncbi:hypothetical protein N7495_005347 [Penicillium taxi]|uniref:uncharacterized protein n=1 Tax=Penicillium taxi TaxID=168475 RepID=UPI002544E1C7|nr:uncharacterized protein N7495_005347 [Penicillium taxi]KAJ5893656.1 hypothetical protein N7495_005347 [Penicillium taxi]